MKRYIVPNSLQTTTLSRRQGQGVALSPTAAFKDMKMPERRCNTCNFYVPNPDEPRYECRRYAPRWNSGVGSGCEEHLWPCVKPDYWCGEWLALAPKLKTMEICGDSCPFKTFI